MKKWLLQPGKAIAFHQNSDSVRVMLFDDRTDSLIWVPRSKCILLSLRTWSHIWQQDWTQTGGRYDSPFGRLFRHLLMLLASGRDWFIGATAGCQIVSQQTIHIPDSFFLPVRQAVKWMDTLFLRSEIQRPRRIRRKDTRIKCPRRGCPKKGGSKWGTECHLCEVRFVHSSSSLILMLLLD